MKFPKTEPEIIALAQQILSGLNSNPNLANSPVTKGEFMTMLNAFLEKRDAIVIKEAEVGEMHDEKDDLQEDLTGAMKRIITYLEAITNNDTSELASVGWSGEEESVKQVPGQPRALEIISRTDANIFLDWKNPADGGRVASYRAERRERPAGSWETCGAANKSEILLINQPRGKELEYRIVAFNSTGDSIPSNTVAATF